jgi:hypothetical protein
MSKHCNCMHWANDTSGQGNNIRGYVSSKELMNDELLDLQRGWRKGAGRGTSRSTILCNMSFAMVCTINVSHLFV